MNRVAYFRLEQDKVSGPGRAVFNFGPTGPWWVEGGLEGSRSTSVFVIAGLLVSP